MGARRGGRTGGVKQRELENTELHNRAPSLSAPFIPATAPEVPVEAASRSQVMKGSLGAAPSSCSLGSRFPQHSRLSVQQININAPVCTRSVFNNERICIGVIIHNFSFFHRMLPLPLQTVDVHVLPRPARNSLELTHTAQEVILITSLSCHHRGGADITSDGVPGVITCRWRRCEGRGRVGMG